MSNRGSQIPYPNTSNCASNHTESKHFRTCMHMHAIIQAPGSGRDNNTWDFQNRTYPNVSCKRGSSSAAGFFFLVFKTETNSFHLDLSSLLYVLIFFAFLFVSVCPRRPEHPPPSPCPWPCAWPRGYAWRADPLKTHDAFIYICLYMSLRAYILFCLRTYAYMYSKWTAVEPNNGF